MELLVGASCSEQPQDLSPVTPHLPPLRGHGVKSLSVSASPVTSLSSAKSSAISLLWTPILLFKAQLD